MVTVKFFGLLRLDLKSGGAQVDAADMKGLFNALAAKYGMKPADFKNYLCYLNGKAITGGKLSRAKLKDGDEVMLMSSAAGG